MLAQAAEAQTSAAPLIWLIVGVLLVAFGGTALMRAFRRNLLTPTSRKADQPDKVDAWEESARRMPTPPPEAPDSSEA